MKLILFLFSICLNSTDNPKPLSKIGVLYYTFIDTNLRVELLKNISSTYSCTVTEISGMATIPKGAYYKPRNRYRAVIVLDELRKIPDFDRIIGITSKDISDTNNGIYDWGIIGLGSCPGKACVISTFRIKTPDKKLFNDRFIKIALHEIGHTFGLPHCTFSKQCFMESASGSIKTVDGETRALCTNCKKLLNQLN